MNALVSVLKDACRQTKILFAREGSRRRRGRRGGGRGFFHAVVRSRVGGRQHPPAGPVGTEELGAPAITLAREIGAAGVAVFTRNGLRPQSLAVLRAPRRQGYAFTDDPQVFRHLLPVWSAEPFLIAFTPEPERTIRDAFAYLQRRGWVTAGDWMVVVTNVLAGDRVIDSIQMRPVE